MKTKFLITVLLLLTFSIALPRTADANGVEKPATTGLELWRAMEMAEQNNPGFKSSNVEKEKSEIDIKIAEGMQSPKIDIWGSTTLSDYPYTVVPIREVGVSPPLDRHIIRFGVELNIPLYTGGKLQAEKKSAQIRIGITGR